MIGEINLQRGRWDVMMKLKRRKKKGRNENEKIDSISIVRSTTNNVDIKLN